MQKPIVIDFETEAIAGRPKAPKPVGAAILVPGKKPQYLAWGHPTENNTDLAKAKAILKDIWTGERPLLFHNAKFDLDVAEQHLGLKLPSWERVHDTMYTLFLKDPHARSLSLKPSAEAYLGMPPDERDAVFDWLADHGIIQKPRKVKGELKYPDGAGAHIGKAPGKLVGEYAIGDVVRTLALHEKLYPEIVKLDMQEPYDRERELMPILLANEKQGIRVDLPALEKDLAIYEAALVKADNWLRKKLKAPGLNLDSNEDTAAALKRSGVVKSFPRTAPSKRFPEGQESLSKKALTEEYFCDQQVTVKNGEGKSEKHSAVWLALYYRNALTTVLSMSMRPWFEKGSAAGGYIYTEWNQVRQAHGAEKFKGARSGRVTCGYFQNITKTFMDRGDGYCHPAFMEVPELPLVRHYLIADEGDDFGHSDFDQQEMKIVAHYEDGALAEAYRTNPKTDIHTDVQALIKKVTGKHYERRPVKVVDFQTAYGGGVPALMNTLAISHEEASELRSAWKKALPDVVKLDEYLKSLFKQGDFLRTLGGRVYYCKPPTIATKGPRKGQRIDFAYTALNYIVQPSAADQTKQAIIDYHKHPKRKARMAVTVHDEINISMPKGRAAQELKILQECMVNAMPLDVPVTTTLKQGPSWGKLQKVAT